MEKYRSGDSPGGRVGGVVRVTPPPRPRRASPGADAARATRSKEDTASAGRLPGTCHTAAISQPPPAFFFKKKKKKDVWARVEGEMLQFYQLGN